MIQTALFLMTPIITATGEWKTHQAPWAKNIGGYLGPAPIMPATGWTDFGGVG